MSFTKNLSLAMFLLVTLVGAHGYAQESAADGQQLKLSSGLMDLLRNEMRQILNGIQSIPAAIVTADWQKVAATGHQISTSYILRQKITAAQKKELHHALPEYFKILDENFHSQASKLAMAASEHDAQLATFYYSRLIESCVACHSVYATAKFPGFVSHSPSGHSH